MRDRRRCNSWEIPPQPPATRAISQWARSLEWRHAVTLHIPVGKICISFFLFYCEDMLSLVVLWLCGINPPLASSTSTFNCFFLFFSRWAAYSPEIPAPTTMTSYWAPFVDAIIVKLMLGCKLYLLNSWEKDIPATLLSWNKWYLFYKNN